MSYANVVEIAHIGAGAEARVRLHGETGMVTATLQNRSTAYADGGTTSGAEPNNTIPRGAYSIRRNGNEVLIDINVGGVVRTLSLGTAA